MSVLYPIEDKLWDSFHPENHPLLTANLHMCGMLIASPSLNNIELPLAQSYQVYVCFYSPITTSQSLYLVLDIISTPTGVDITN